MSKPPINIPGLIHVTGVLETLLAECVGQAPELVTLGDWRTMALRLSRRLEESGLHLGAAGTSAQQRSRIAGPLRAGEVVLALADGPDQTVVMSVGLPMHTLPDGVQHQVWRDMLEQGIIDLETARKAKREGKSNG